MSRRIDFSTLTGAERAVLLSAGLLFFNGMIPWWYRVETAGGSWTYNAGLTGWGIIACLAGAAAAVGVLLRANIWPEPAPGADGTAYSALGALAVAALTLQMVSARAEWIGFYVALALAGGLLVAGWRRRIQRRRGWT